MATVVVCHDPRGALLLLCPGELLPKTLRSGKKHTVTFIFSLCSVVGHQVVASHF